MFKIGQSVIFSNSFIEKHPVDSQYPKSPWYKWVGEIVKIDGDTLYVEYKYAADIRVNNPIMYSASRSEQYGYLQEFTEELNERKRKEIKESYINKAKEL
jgi:hypothetical protein